MPTKLTVSTQQAGQQLRRVRERLGLRYRDVENASLQLAESRANYEFVIGLSRLADIENKGTLPSLYRLYSLCAVYKLRFSTVLRWYGIELQDLTSDSLRSGLERTAFVAPDLGADSEATGIEMESRTRFLQGARDYDGGLLASMNLFAVTAYRKNAVRYAHIGAEDRSMSPLLPPGSIVQIDETDRKIEFTPGLVRPVYLLETRDGLKAGWCRRHAGLLYLQVVPESGEGPFAFREPDEADVVGRIVAVAKHIGPGLEPRVHFEVDQESLQSQ